MLDNPITVSLVINAPVEQVWPLLLFDQQPNLEDMPEQKFIKFQIEPEGPPVAGQIGRLRIGCFHMTVYVDQIVQAEPPLEGRTTFGRLRVFGKEGQSVSSWFRDVEHHHAQTQSDLKHPWFMRTEQIDKRCLPIDSASCVVVYAKQSEATFCLLPRWLRRQFVSDETLKNAEKNAMEATLQTIKTKAEQNFEQTGIE